MTSHYQDSAATVSQLPAGQTHASFQSGDRIVVLHGGLYYGLDGLFVGFRPDQNWADVEEPGGRIRSHPVAWLRSSPGVPLLR